MMMIFMFASCFATLYDKTNRFVKVYDFEHMTTYERPRRRTEQAIVDATLTCLLRDGYGRLNVTAIAAEADYGRGTFYRYFDSVDDVLLLIFQRQFARMQADIHAMMAALESPEKEIRAWQMVFERLTEIRPLLEVLSHPEAIHLTERFQEMMIAGFVTSLATRAFRYPQWMDLPQDIMATFTAGAVFSVIRKWIGGELPYSAVEMGQMVYKLLYHS
jgi:AcrR family transcriptional regulator